MSGLHGLAVPVLPLTVDINVRLTAESNLAVAVKETMNIFTPLCDSPVIDTLHCIHSSIYYGAEGDWL